MRQPGDGLLQKIDAEWPLVRQPSDNAANWTWLEIRKRSADAFCLVSEAGSVLAIWASRKAHPISLIDGKFYRIDFLEVEPSTRSAGLGALAIALCARRALELDVDGLLAAVFPNLVPFYELLGFRPRQLDDWIVEHGLIAYEARGGSLAKLASQADAFIDE